MHCVGFTWKDGEEEPLGDMIVWSTCPWLNMQLAALLPGLQMSPTALVTVSRRDMVAMPTVKVQYITNQGVYLEKEALIDEHLVGRGGCVREVEDYLN